MVRNESNNSGADLKSTKRSARKPAGQQEQTAGIEDATMRAMIAQLDDFEWKVDVKVKRARQLRPVHTLWKGASSSLDSYVKLQLGGQKCRTKTVKQNLNPVWNQCYAFDFGTDHECSLTDNVRLAV